MSEERNYAYGDWTIEGAACPVEAAGFKNHPWVIEVAERYDSMVQTKIEGEVDEGTITEEQAKDVWNDLVQFLENKVNQFEHRESEHTVSQKLELAKKVNSKLFE